MTRNQKLHVLHVDSAQAFADGLKLQHVRGDTLLFDFVYFLHPVSHSSKLLMFSGVSEHRCAAQCPFIGPQIQVQEPPAPLLYTPH